MAINGYIDQQNLMPLPSVTKANRREHGLFYLSTAKKWLKIENGVIMSCNQTYNSNNFIFALLYIKQHVLASYNKKYSFFKKNWTCVIIKQWTYIAT